MVIAIVDDNTIDSLHIKKIILSEFDDDVVIIEHSIFTALVEKINEIKPDILFLEVELKKWTGFDIIKSLSYLPQIIITATSEKHALQAIKAQVVGYILKPVDEKELCNILLNCKDKIEKKNTVPTTNQKKFTFSSKRKSLDMAEILYFEGAGAYVYCVTIKEKILVSKNIGRIEKMLSEMNLIRCHQSYIVNLNHVVKFEQKRNGKLFLTFGDEIPVSQRKMKLVKKQWNENQ